MNKPVTPKQLELTAGKTREELLIQTLPPHIDPESPTFKVDMAKVDKIEKEEAARAVLGMDEVETKVRSTANSILASAGLPPIERDFDDFDWKSDPSVVLQEQRATAVYHNPYSGIVIRQERLWDEESDPYVVISAENIVTFMEALAKRARE
jgi:hypothetical protein